MGEWIKNDYYGQSLTCPQCRRNYVKQTFAALYANVKCLCAWCGCKWEMNSIVRDSYQEEYQPAGFKYSNEGD